MNRFSQTIVALATGLLLMSGAQSASFLPLGNHSRGGDLDAFAISADGKVVVGVITFCVCESTAFRWTADGGIVSLGDFPGYEHQSRAQGVSADGSVVVGDGTHEGGTDAFRWTADTGLVNLDGIDNPSDGVNSHANDISADGSVVVGGGAKEAFRWTADTGMVGLGDLEGGNFYSRASGVSAGGNVVVGRSTSALSSALGEAFRWTADTGMVGLGDLPGGDFESIAYDVSADGSVVVGSSDSDSGREAFRWTAATGLVGLGDFEGGSFSSGASGVSADGNVVVGYSQGALGAEAFIWTPATGLQRLLDVLVANGATGLTGWSLESATDITPDGRTIVGNGTNPLGDTEAWVATLDGNADVTGVVDMSGDAVADVAYLTPNGQPKIRYYSGASRKKIKGVSYLGPAWAGVAAATVVDSNADGVANDPAVAVLAHRARNGTHAVEVRRADNGELLNKIFFLSSNWTVIDVAVIDDRNGDGVSGDTAIAVLAHNPNKPFTEQIRVQVRRLSDGALQANWHFLNGNWTALALEGISRRGASPLLAVLAIKASTGANFVQARRLSDGAIKRDTIFFDASWLARDVAMLADSDGNGTANDPAYLVLANHPETGRNKVQARRVSDGQRLKNIPVLRTNWEGTRVTSTGDLSGNQREEVGVLADRRTDDTVAIQLKDYADRTTTKTILP